MKILSESHVDHGITRSQVEYIKKRFEMRKEFFVETVDLGVVGQGIVPCGLHGPVMGDASIGEEEVEYAARGNRAYTSRLVDRVPRMTNLVTVIAGPHSGEPCVMYTAFGGPMAPMEVGDPSLSAEAREEAEKFWAQHALSKPAEKQEEACPKCGYVDPAAGQGAPCPNCN